MSLFLIICFYDFLFFNQYVRSRVRRISNLDTLDLKLKMVSFQCLWAEPNAGMAEIRPHYRPQARYRLSYHLCMRGNNKNVKIR